MCAGSQVPRSLPQPLHTKRVSGGQAEGLLAGRPGLQVQRTDASWVRFSTLLQRGCAPYQGFLGDLDGPRGMSLRC